MGAGAGGRGEACRFAAPRLRGAGREQTVHNFCKFLKLQGVQDCRRPLPKIASFFSIDFKPQNFSKMCQNGFPVGRQIEPKIDKSRKNRVLKTHLKPTPQKTSKISDFGRLRDLPNRAETLARTPFSRFQGVTEKSSNMSQKVMLLGTSGHKKHRTNIKKA